MNPFTKLEFDRSVRIISYMNGLFSGLKPENESPLNISVRSVRSVRNRTADNIRECLE